MSALRKNSSEEIVRLSSSDDLGSYIESLAGHGPQHEAVVEVDRDDDLTSVRSKLESVRVQRVVLVIRSGVKALRDGIEFRVLRRLQRELGLDLILVSDDMTRRGFASENGFRKVFPSLRAYYGNRHVEPDGSTMTFTDPEEFTPSFNATKWGIMVAGVLMGVLGIVLYVTVPLATVVVYPRSQAMTRDIQILVEIGGPRIDTTSQRLAGRVVEQRVTVDGTIATKDAPPPTGNSGFQPGTNVTLEARDAVRDQLLKKAGDQATQGLRTQLKSNESLPEASIHTEVTSERYNHNIGDVAESLSGSMELVATSVAFVNDDFNALVNALWAQDIPKGYESTGSPKLTAPAVVSAEGQHMTLKVRATGALLPELDTGAVAAAARMHTPKEAEAAVAKAGDFSRLPEISMWPNWASRTLRVQVKAIAEAPTP